jgi:protease-4
MSISQAEMIVDRRQLKRRLIRWRVLAVLALLIAFGSFFWSGDDFKKYFDHVARVHIDGLITGDEATLNLLDELAKSNHVKGVIIRIDSPAQPPAPRRFTNRSGKLPRTSRLLP